MNLLALKQTSLFNYTPLIVRKEKKLLFPYVVRKYFHFGNPLFKAGEKRKPSKNPSKKNSSSEITNPDSNGADEIEVEELERNMLKEIEEVLGKKKIKKLVGNNGNKPKEPSQTSIKKNKSKSPILSDGTTPHTVLLDATPLLHKVHNIHKHLKNGTLFGFTRFLLRLMDEARPYTHFGACFDPLGRNTFRKKLFPEYKMNHPEPATDVLLQMKLIPEATKACGIAHIVVEEFEADDVIATYVRQAMELKHKVSIVTFDRNFLQLVSPSVQLYDIKDKEILDTESALNVWGTSPDRIEHLRAFLGDPNDNSEYH